MYMYMYTCWLMHTSHAISTLQTAKRIIILMTILSLRQLFSRLGDRARLKLDPQQHRTCSHTMSCMLHKESYTPSSNMYMYMFSVLPSIHKACQPIKPSVHNFLWCVNRENPKCGHRLCPNHALLTFLEFYLGNTLMCVQCIIYSVVDTI